MTKLNTKSEVDQYAQKLLSVSKNNDDIEIQCLAVAELYFQVSEFVLAKCYIGRYLKFKSNSESGLILKAKIHEKLTENISAFQCYELLYTISKKNEYMIKICDSLLKGNFEGRIARVWIDKLEEHDPDSQQLCALKLKYYTELTDISQELEKLRNKLVRNTTYHIKRQYLSVLEKFDDINILFENFVDIINHYDVLDDLETVLICVRIIRKASALIKESVHKKLHCILLISVIKNGMTLVEVNSSQYLEELYPLLNVNDDDEIYIELRAQFLYYLVSYAHWRAIDMGELSDSLSECLYHGYAIVCSINKFVVNANLQTCFFTWLSHQSLLRVSVAHHMIYSADQSFKVNINLPTDRIRMIISFSKVLIDTECKFLSKLFDIYNTYSPCEVSTIVIQDIECFPSQSADFSLIIWQLLCHLKVFENNNFSNLYISKSASDFIITLLKHVFPKLPLRTKHNRCPENISLVDIITFLVGAVLTYRKLLANKIVGHFPIPFSCSKSIIGVNDTITKWWYVTCDFLLDNKYNTSNGALQEFLKKGLKMVQCVEIQLSDIIKLQLGLNLVNFAKDNTVINEACVDRAIYFLMSAVQSSAVISTCCSLPTTSSYTASRSNFLNVQQDITLFDVENVSDEMVIKLRFEAFLFCIDWNLKRHYLNDDWQIVDKLIDDAEKFKRNSPQLFLLKSKVYLLRATNLSNEKECDTEKFQFLLSMASKYVESCDQNLNSLTILEQKELKVLLQQQRLALTKFNYQLHSHSCDDPDLQPVHFSDTNLSANNSQVPFFQPKFSNDVFNLQNNKETLKLERYLKTIGQSNEKLDQNLSCCFMKCEDVKTTLQNDQLDIRRIKCQTTMHNKMYASQTMKMEALTRKVDRLFWIENNYQRLQTENSIIKEQLKSLINIVQEVEEKNINLELELAKYQQCFTIDKIMKPSLDSFYQMIDSALSNANKVVNEHLKSFTEMEKKIIIKSFQKEKTKKDLTKRSLLDNKDEKMDTSGYSADSGYFKLFSKEQSPIFKIESKDNSADVSSTRFDCSTQKEAKLSSIGHSKKVQDKKTKNIFSNDDGDMDFDLGANVKNSNFLKNDIYSQRHYSRIENSAQDDYNSDISDKISYETCGMEDDKGSYYESEMSRNLNTMDSRRITNQVEDADIDYESLFEIIPIEDEWKCVYSKDCKLFRNYNNTWSEHGQGEIRILVQEDIDTMSVRLLMKRKSDGSVCCNQLVLKTCPTFCFIKFPNAAISWSAQDYSNGCEAIKEHFALRFKSVKELKNFTTVIEKLQEKI